MLDRFTEQARELLAVREGRPLAIRVEISGECPAHEDLSSQPERWKNEIRSLAVETSAGELWVEKVSVRSSLPGRQTNVSQYGPVGELVQYINTLSTDDNRIATLGAELAELKRKLPVELREGSDALRLDDPAWLSEILGQARHMLVGKLSSKQSVARS